MFLSRLSPELHQPFAKLDSIFANIETPTLHDVEAWDEDESIIVQVDLPGRRREDIKVSWEGTSLIVNAMHNPLAEQSDTAKRYLIKRSEPKTYSRTISLPATVDPESASATYKDGVLEITIPKIQRAKARLIEIK